MKKNGLLVVIACLLLIFALVGCADALLDQRNQAISQVEALLQGEEYASLGESTIQGVIDNAISQINLAESEEAIQKAVSDAIASLEQLVFDGVKASAKQTLSGYVDLSKLSAEAKALIEAKISDAEAAIDACATKAEVEGKVAAVKAELDIIVAKEDASKKLEAYDLTKYSDENKALIEGKISQAKDAISSLTSVTEINAKLDAVKAEIDNIPTLLKETQNAAIADIEGYITSKDEYSEKGLAEINSIINDAKDNINKASDIALISNIVEDAKSDLDKVLNSREEREAEVLELYNSMEPDFNDAFKNGFENYVRVDGTDIIIDTRDDIDSTCLHFGNQEGNTATVFDTYLTVNYRSPSGPVVSIRFRAWDTSSCLIFDIKKDSVVYYESVWDNNLDGDDKTVKTAIIKDSNGIKDGEKVHLQIICWGYTKKVFINGECVFSIVKESYCQGRIYIQTWQAGVILSNPKYIEYATDAELYEIWKDEIDKECINKTEQQILKEAKEAACASVKASLEGIGDIYSNENQEVIIKLVEDGIVAIEACTSVDKVNETLADVKGKIEKVATLEDERALAEAKIAAKNEINGYLKDIELNYSKENQVAIDNILAESGNIIDGCNDITELNNEVDKLKTRLNGVLTLKQEADIELLNNMAAAKKEINEYLSDVASIYSEANQAVIAEIISQGESSISGCENKDAIDAAVILIKEKLDAVLTKDEEAALARVKEFKESMTSLVGEVVEKHTRVEGTDIIIDTVNQDSTILYFGSPRENTAAVFDTYLTVNYRSTQWSSVSIRFRAWDANTCYIFDIRDGSVVFKKNRDGASIVIVNDSNGIKQQEKIHLQIICCGWTKKVLINGECVFNIVENDYNVGNIYIETWQAGVVLSEPTYIEYATDAELEAVWGTELAKECINKTEQEKLNEAKAAAKTEISSYIENLDNYGDAGKAAISSIIEAGNSTIDNCSSIEEVNTAVSSIKTQLDGVDTKEAEEAALAAAKESAKSDIAGCLSDVENAYSEENQSKISTIISTGNTLIDECNSVDEVNEAVVQIKNQLKSIPTIEQENNPELYNKKIEAKETISSYLSDVENNYSEEKQAEIASIISAGEQTIMGCQTEDAIDLAVENIKKALDEVLTTVEETLAAQTARAEAFLDSLSNVSGDLISDMSVTDGKLVVDSKKVNYGGDFQFGIRDNNMNKAFDAYITIDYNNAEWDSVAIRFCAWDYNTTLKMVIMDNSIKFYKTYWDNDKNTGVDVLLSECDKGIKNGQEAHLQIVTRGWTKAVILDDECIFKCWPDSYHNGLMMIGSWQAGITLRDPIYKVYGSEDEVTADYGDVLNLPYDKGDEINGKF